MDKQRKQTRRASSFFFTLRIWREQLGENQSEWRGQIEHVLSGKTGYFRDWSTLVSFLEKTLDMLEPVGFSGTISPNENQEIQKNKQESK